MGQTSSTELMRERERLIVVASAGRPAAASAALARSCAYLL
jgi:hypothetical protein